MRLSVPLCMVSITLATYVKAGGLQQLHPTS